MTILLLTFVTALFLSGCSTSKEKMFPHSSETMSDIYNKKTGGGASQLFDNRLQLRREVDNLTQNVEMMTHTRTAEQEINNLFQRLPNPDLVMYVYPHLTNGKLPVPGYSTAFSFYGDVQYAMPGERVDNYYGERVENY
ncbi:TIGR03751 family conjugal transfer lipoprotein [Gilliamella sp. B2776]|nr:TIGR03751 family conjugal transfer lipoprotein [Gilliamella sp. B2717]MCX8649582.1 TIGR03751 family conjugal transfer lipoprotein [Gilliamella sp. B2779]MCX8654900.1 TIGR03751 family conjugal transfer lipoprotein [Gilliamella sp. B2737]MCX8691428.1 TIGR03751 family conjugal transfer lipoprotein [Gilliamella sp. B2776]MCX8702511.1 TIGR03751 family conjugal transfer lipoprotein [Gilliamella sp. B2781]MCX8727150.1 TIGR03751 family conjugal transfer lipoprotein [Gilliamella sp. B2838]MCX872927